MQSYLTYMTLEESKKLSIEIKYNYEGKNRNGTFYCSFLMYISKGN